LRAIRRAKVQGKQGARFRRAGPRSERKMSLPRTRRYPRLCPPHGDSQGAKPTRDGTMAGTPADHGASTNEGAGTSESASATTTNEPASETPSSSDSDSDSDSDSSIELPEWTHLETPTTGTCPLCLGRRTLPGVVCPRSANKPILWPRADAGINGASWRLRSELEADVTKMMKVPQLEVILRIPPETIQTIRKTARGLGGVSESPPWNSNDGTGTVGPQGRPGQVRPRRGIPPS
jgi:hypothetical protein